MVITAEDKNKNKKVVIMEVDDDVLEEAAAVVAGELFNAVLEGVIVDDNLSDSDSSSDSNYDDFDSSDDDEHGARRHIHKIPNYIGNTVHLYDEKTFRSHFRLRRREVYHLIERYRQTNYLVNNEPHPGAITHEKAFLLTLYYLANTETFREISDRFDLSQSAAHGALQNTLDFINSLQEEYIVWPHNREEKQRISQQFSEVQDIHGVIGATDGCHIRIKRPMELQCDYYNRKQFHSVVIQATSKSDNIITDVHIGEPGSMHDARVLRRSPLYAAAQENPDFMDGFFHLGDSAYPNLPWIIPPFRDNGYLTDQERDFNNKHSSMRICVEHTFGFLKGIFRRLRKFNNILIHLIIKCIMAACILHNIVTLARNNGDYDNEDDYYDSDSDTDDDDNVDDDADDNEYHYDGANVRDRRDYIFQRMYPPEEE